MDVSPRTPPAIVVLGTSGLATARRIAAALPGAQIHGAASRVNESDVDVLFVSAADHLRALFVATRPIIGICAAGILIRCLGPALADKGTDPPVVAVAEDGTSTVPLLGGHHGANALSLIISGALGGHAAITTAGDLRFGVALDAPPEGWSLINPERTKDVMATLLAGDAVRVDAELDWLVGTDLPTSHDARWLLQASLSAAAPQANELRYVPRRLVVGVGSERGCPPENLIGLIADTLTANDISRQAIACLVSLDLKADETAIHEAADHFGVPARFVTADAIRMIADRISEPSDIVQRAVGVPAVAEGAALAAVGDGALLVSKQIGARATCAIAAASKPLDPARIGQARGSVAIVGIGPGTPEWRSGEASRLLKRTTDWVGYGLYLDLVQDLLTGQREHRFPLGAEEDRVRHALLLAAEGRDVALVCSGDPGIYAMATLVYEVLALAESAGGLPDAARRVAIATAPGISAVQAAAARAGAPIGHDFCCISLSDLLTPWPAIERRIEAAAAGDFVTAFYNPRSLRRRDQLPRAIEILSAARPADTPVIIAANLGRPGETITVTTISAFDTDKVDMMSLVIVGSSATRLLERGDGTTRVFTPRGYGTKREAAA